ncbi:MAG: sigma-70 family RNA polymerase sigma factor [Sedimentisphaerales bacterium]|nr:sigma-70 family RNA polymerase sigma factor [Sedimentisphaerales bacterium]
MLEDRSLVRRFNAGDTQALGRIYEKYRRGLFQVAGALLHDPAAVEDVVHDAFVAFASQAGRFELKGSLKGYLAICVANRARNIARQDRPISPERLRQVEPQRDSSEIAADSDLHEKVRATLAGLAPEQNQTIVLHVLGSLRFREIAHQTGESVNTVKSRYRYGIAKLRSVLDGQVER